MACGRVQFRRKSVAQSRPATANTVDDAQQERLELIRHFRLHAFGQFTLGVEDRTSRDKQQNKTSQDREGCAHEHIVVARTQRIRRSMAPHMCTAPFGASCLVINSSMYDRAARPGIRNASGLAGVVDMGAVTWSEPIAAGATLVRV